MTRELTQAQLQEYWDACLIKRWRKFGTVLDAIYEWERLTGRRFNDTEMLRKPKLGFPWQIGMRIFVADFLPKINDRLHDQSPDKDVALLKKLQTSTYTTLKTAVRTAMTRSIDEQKAALDKNRAIAKLNSELYKSRNHDTDWGVTKASRRHTR